MELREGIRTRRSVRSFTAEPVARETLHEVLRAGTWAPSGLNNQPWRFVTVADPGLRARLAALTRYGRVIEGAPVCVAVFADREVMYHEAKDHQAMGACIQNILLAAHAAGLGAVWLGEILKNADKVRDLLDVPATLELQAVVALGHPAGETRSPGRRGLEEVLLKER